MKNKEIILLLASILLLSCNSDRNNLEIIQKLEKERDSLKTIIDTLNTKYIFDNASIRLIVDKDSIEKIGSEYKGEFVFVGYNEKSIVKFHTGKKDSLLKLNDNGGYDFKGKVENPDKIKLMLEFHHYKKDIGQYFGASVVSFEKINIDK
ncbi:hypothetical protein [Aureivirga marina]|uniref:hypothetical protein n=1 Tax=Aureivirga marina TaxID=1182451 RepID=UPI0018CAD6E8|nr:hypothetical protein [Aureivirga marina]